MTATTPTHFRIEPVTTPTDLENFLDVPDRVYRGDRHWVPPLRSDIAKQLAPDNPFQTYGTLQAFVAYNPDPVGRIVVAVNQRLVEREGAAVGLFGFFECIDDFEIAAALMEAAIHWLRERGMAIARGPIDLSTHNRCLMLVEGFDESPFVMMPYNPAYYPTFMEKLGFTKGKDAYSFDFDLQPDLSKEFEKAHRIALRSGVSFRPVCLKGEGFERDARSLYRLFTQAFANNYSSTPRTEEDFLEEAKALQTLVDPDIFPIAEVDGQMVGFFMALPDYNIPLKQVNGRLNPWGILKFLWFRRQIDRARVLVICSLPGYRRKMVPLALIYLGLQGGKQKGKPYQRAELGHVYEDNLSSIKLVEAAGGKRYKTFRIYEKAIIS